ncbi:MAG TPA: PRD domain-containing protein [Cellulomonas sp.]
MRVRKVYNNNIVLAVQEDGNEMILLGRSIGFNTRPGQEVTPGHVERLFVPLAGRDSDSVARLVAQLSIDDVRLATEIAEAGRETFSLPLHERVVLPLADHLKFAIERVGTGLVVESPFEFEVPTFYPRETELARWALRHVAETRGVQLPAGEVIPLALHFVNGQFSSGDVSKAISYTTLFGDIVAEVVAAQENRSIREPLAVSRLITHLRYLIVRKEQGGSPETPQFQQMGESFRTAHPAAWATAVRIADRLSTALGQPVLDDEVLYIALHVARAGVG